jgi:hypothetical protein
MRRFRGGSVCPVITLTDTHMNTRFGGRQRPHFDVKRWVNFGGEGGAQPVLPPSTGHTVEPPTAKEATGDSVPY